MTIMLVAVSSYSLVVTFPCLVAEMMNPHSKSPRNYNDTYFYDWAKKIIFPWNYCGNFFFYVFSGRQFREELRMMFCRCLKRTPGTPDIYFVNRPIIFVHHNFYILLFGGHNAALYKLRQLDVVVN